MERTARYLAIILFVLLLGGLFYSNGILFSLGRTRVAENRLIFHTNNTSRVSGENLADYQGRVAEHMYDAKNGIRPDSIILASSRDWKQALRGLSLCAWPANNFLLLTDENKIDGQTIELIGRLNPGGITFRGELTHIISLAPLSADNQEVFIKSGYSPAVISTVDYFVLLSMFGIRPPTVIVSDGTLPSHTAFTASYTAATGTPVIFTEQGKISSLELRWLTGLGVKNIVWTGRAGMPSSLRALFNRVKLKVFQVAGSNPYLLSIRWARTFLPGIGFGWRPPQPTEEGWRNFMLAPIEDWTRAVSGAQLARNGAAGPVLWTEGGRLKPAVENYLWQCKPEYFKTPVEGPYFHAWILGNLKEIDWAVQAKVDIIGEIAPYEEQGEMGLSGLEALGLVWLIISVSSALWVAGHIFIRMEAVRPVMKWAWIINVLLTGPIGFYLYVRYYLDGVSQHDEEEGSLFSGRVFPFTLVCFSFISSVFILSVFFISVCGQPLLPASGFFLRLGSPEFLTTIASFITAWLTGALIILPFLPGRKLDVSYKETFRQGLLRSFILTTAIATGMLLFMRFLIGYLPAAPREGSLLWWAMSFWSSTVGLIFAYAAGRFFALYDAKKLRKSEG